ncbi:MAG TPA: response regulator [bacterium (Candidatus Stahlbacteria)]|nr:response regulator [Candidatus Stahlbacteria bacterium]
MDKQAKILIVDDDPDFVEATKIVLESKSYKVAVASDGREGLQAVKKEKPDLIILDIMMTTGDEGFDVCRKLKRDPKYKDIPILMLTALQKKTGFDFKSEVGDEYWLPVEDYVDKPLPPSELLSRVEKLLKTHSKK